MDVFKELIREGIERGASDIHILSNHLPVFRIYGHLQSACERQHYSGAEIKNLARKLIHSDRYQQMEEDGQIDFAVSLADVGRVRINLYSQNSSWSMAVRILPADLPDYISLGLPESIQPLLLSKGGLILVAGTTGSGKTTSLAAMINWLNQTRSLNIITLEDPVEYLYGPGTCLVNQREIGRDTKSFASGLKAALRQDPDLIMLGELRDSETVFTALAAAQTGHMVLASLHSGSSTQAIERIVNGFPAYQQSQIRIQLASTLLAIVTQQLIPAKGGEGRVLAAEILISNTAISNLIRDNRIYQIPSAIQTGGAWGMRNMDQAIQILGDHKRISQEDCNRLQTLKRLCREGRKTHEI